MKRAVGLLLLSLPVLAACGLADDGERLRRLVGEGNLPQVEVHPSESIRIDLIVDEPEGRPHARHLEFNIGADHSLGVRRYRVERALGPPYLEPVMEAEERVRLPGATAADIRKRLAVFRPQNLTAEGPFVMPKGCGFITHNPSEAVIEFTAPNKMIGLFVVQEGCDHENVAPLKDELRRILA